MYCGLEVWTLHPPLDQSTFIACTALLIREWGSDRFARWRWQHFNTNTCMKTTRASSLSYFGVVNSGYNICIWILHFYAPSKAYDIRGWQSSVVLFPEEFRFLFCLLGRRMKYLRRWNGWCNDDNKKLPSVSLTIGLATGWVSLLEVITEERRMKDYCKCR